MLSTTKGGHIGRYIVRQSEGESVAALLSLLQQTYGKRDSEVPHGR